MPDQAPRKTRARREGDRRTGDRRSGDRRRQDRRARPPVPAVLEVCDDDVAAVADQPVERVVIEERRRHERIGLGRQASVKHRVHATEGLLDDISAGGAQFTTTDLDLRPPKGSFVSISFDCRHGKRQLTLTCIGRVVRSRAFHNGEADVRSFSVRFADPLDVELLSFD